jgi:hypothetical protein
MLVSIGFTNAGAGHGTSVFIGLFSAPVGLAQNYFVALASIPFLWPIMAFLAASSQRLPLRLVFLCAMCSHYVSLPWILNGPSRFADWSYMKKLSAESIGFAFGVYGVGQVALWVLFLIQLFRRGKPANNEKEAE